MSRPSARPWDGAARAAGAAAAEGASSAAGRREPRHQTQVLRGALLTGLPGFALAMALLWTGTLPAPVKWALTLLVAGMWIGLAAALRKRVVHPLQTLANQLGALRGGDFALRARGARADDALGLVLLEANALSATLREQRIGAMEATALLRKVIEEIDVAVFAFDEQVRLRLVNRAGERLLGRPRERLLGLGAEEVGLAVALEGKALRTVDHAFPGGSGRWQIRRDPFRQGGRRHRLLVISDLSSALREEERQAWQRLIRVLSHEINNSLAPIQSIAGTLHKLTGREPPPPDLRDDLLRGLDVIGCRARALGDFMAEYARLARLPPPTLRPMEVGDWVRHAAGLETRVAVQVAEGAPVEIRADRDQLDQLMINLLRNAADAVLETGGGVRVGWGMQGETVEIRVEDDGPGLPETANLFVPFFTTKPHGTGIGLVLSRQIAENLGGTLTLRNRTDARGCVARLVLPAGST
ncbi:sensor histidine kinase [Longimicrobium sp.]|uniref:sensor histidine kinase n=1 Tax=Longimicrobium sp. TaxID=2029185 RepID=UPI002C291E3B|nr:ATP-binding protein [Longimicrobium sp.]HSU17572.1 ATP-binding protein [Longimicrobium sp.]